MNRELGVTKLGKFGIISIIGTAIAMLAVFMGITTASAAAPVDYATQVQPIFNASCSCHIGSAQAGVQLNNYTNAHASASKLPGMGSGYLTAAQLQIISDWKSQGALATPPVVTPPSISTASLGAGTVGTAYSQLLAATSGTTPYSWTISSGNLPAGLGLSTGGVISGIPTAAGSFSFTIRVTDAAASTASKSLSIMINAAVVPVNITTSSLANGTAGTAYGQSLAATGGSAPYIWTISAGSLPAGLTLSSSGVISGTPSAAGTASFTVRAADSAAGSATKALSIMVNAAPSPTPKTPPPTTPPPTTPPPATPPPTNPPPTPSPTPSARHNGDDSDSRHGENSGRNYHGDHGDNNSDRRSNED